MTDFAHLHLHTQYSMLDGANLIPDLVKHLKQNNMNACAITDHGWMAGVIDFYKACTKEEVKPLIGVEAYITEDEDGWENDSKTRDNYHAVLIAKDNRGYTELLKFCSEAALNNFYYKPRIYRKKLEQLAGHVICTSACLGGITAKLCEFKEDEYGRAIVCDDVDRRVQKLIEFYASIFNNDFYLEIQDWSNNDNYQPVYNKFIIQKAKEMGLPLVITADAHYLNKNDDRLHDMLMAMQMKLSIEEYKESDEMQYGPHFYVKSPEEMLEGAKRWNVEEAYYNTGAIADKCNVEIELGVYKPPVFDITKADDYQEFLNWKAQPSHNHILECSHV